MESKELTEAREVIEDTIREWTYGAKINSSLANSILNLKWEDGSPMVGVLSKDQKLPELDAHSYSTGCPSCGEEVGTLSDVEIGMQIAKDAGFKKVVSK